jgi:hypothetical protein
MDQNYAHPEGFKAMHLAPSLFLLYCLSLIFIKGLSLKGIYFLPAILYITLDLVFSAAAAAEGKCPACFFVMPFMFLSLHLGYGAGFVWGLVKGIRKDRRVSGDATTVNIRKVDLWAGEDMWSKETSS